MELEVIDVLDTVETSEGKFIDIQLMSDGEVYLSAPYEKDWQAEYGDDEGPWNDPNWDPLFDEDIPF
jgi:hypothetical protein